jgi:hypothetical protein
MHECALGSDGKRNMVKENSRMRVCSGYGASHC